MVTLTAGLIGGSASLHEAHEECRADVPAWEPYEPKPRSSFDTAQRERLQDGGAGLVAHRSGDVLAATFAQRAAFVPMFHNDFTMVRRSARGQRLAQTIKRRLIDEAAAAGIERITTEVRTDNHPMLAINATLGFRRIALRHLVQSTAPELLQ
jgi:L-amino acid N-acyltransferase YncA